MNERTFIDSHNRKYKKFKRDRCAAWHLWCWRWWQVHLRIGENLGLASDVMLMSVLRRGEVYVMSQLRVSILMSMSWLPDCSSLHCSGGIGHHDEASLLMVVEAEGIFQSSQDEISQSSGCV